MDSKNPDSKVALQRYSTSTEPRSPTPASPNGHVGGVVQRVPSLPESGEGDDVFVDEKLKANNNEFPHFAPPPRTPGTAPPADVSWPQKTVSRGRCALIAVGIIVLLLFAAGVGVAIILVKTGPEAESYSLHQRTTAVRTSTTWTRPEAESSSWHQASTTALSSTTETPIVTYGGNLLLMAPWTGSREQLESSLSQDFISVVKNSELEPFYLGASLQHFQAPQNVTFQLDFRQNVTSLASQEPVEQLAQILQRVLRHLIEEKVTVLDINPQYFVMYDIPETPSTSTVTTWPSAASTSSPSAASSSVSTAVLSYSSTLPSSFTTSPLPPPSSLSSAATTAATSVSSPTAPTTSTTSSALSVSGSSLTKLTTATTLMSASTLRTTASTTSSSTQVVTSQAATTSTTPPLPAACKELQFGPCQGLGYSHFSLPNFVNDAKTAEEAANDYFFMANKSLAAGCTTDPTFFCGFAFPPCDTSAEAWLPCLDTCQDTVSKCVDLLPWPLDCESFPTEQPCLKSLFIPATTPPPSACVPQNYLPCKSLGFTSTQYPTWFAETEAANIEAFEKWGMPTIRAGCSRQAEFYMCAMFFPSCNATSNNVSRPCRSLCQEVQDVCYSQSLFNPDCEMFGADPSTCLLPPQVTSSSRVTITGSGRTFRAGDTSTADAATTAPTTTPTITTPVPHQCLPISVNACRHFGHVNGSVPNTWSGTNPAQQFYDYVDPVVSTGCADLALFYGCAMLFPRCDHDVFLYPCRSVCEEYNVKCKGAPNFFHQDCSVLNDNITDEHCLTPPGPRLDCGADFQCQGAPVCVPRTDVCNHVNDCGDWSDERNCTCNADFEFRCDMGLCIRNYRRCDQRLDCPDGSDENKCTKCTRNQFTCPEGTCVMAEWVCDGSQDCLNGEDEKACSGCSMTQDFACTSGECIPNEQRCDGVSQCRDQTDEYHCIFRLEGEPIYLNLRGYAAPVCADGFTMQHAHFACQRLGFGGAVTWTPFDHVYGMYIRMTPNVTSGIKSILGTAELVDDCLNTVRLTCAPAECGSSTLRNMFIVEGTDAPPGSIPWQVSIREYGKHFCGGSLIHPYFVLTAAHCIDKYMTYTYLEVVAGAIDFTIPEASRQVAMVKRVITHPDYVPLEGNDVALVELATAVNFTDDVKPVCLRREGDTFGRQTLCYASGWGRKDPNVNQMATRLQVLKMTLWNTNKCNSSYAWDGGIKNTEICAGFYAGIRAPCQGDSGGPLFCQTPNYTWVLVGVASYVQDGCIRPEKPVVFSNAILYNTWISNNTQCRFKCHTGRCLFDSSMLCNKHDDCGDKSDEIDPCDISTNCTFEDNFLCGYGVNGWLWESQGVSNNRYPLYDYTLGGDPGKYLLAPFRAMNLHTPRIDLMSPHCLRFRYHMRGEVVLGGLTVHAHSLDTSSWREVWARNKLQGEDLWQLGQIDLGAGNFDIVFTPYENAMASIDDITLLSGTCASLGCGSDEFSCKTAGEFNCLPARLRCNVVADCDDASDETSCTDAQYTCDAENGVLCGLRQNSSDAASGEWRLPSARQAGVRDASATGNGHFLKLVTERMLSTDVVYMYQSLYTGGRPHCLSFFYRSTAAVRVEVEFWPVNGSRQVMWSVHNRQTAGWSRTQAEIPSAVRGQLRFVVYGGKIDRQVLHPMFGLDNITILGGVCPDFSCSAGEVQCSSEAFCLNAAQWCDRILDCRGGEDESSCNCTDEEFTCPGGPCIPINYMCDTQRDCPDGSDEGDSCDLYVSVPCDFEDPFLCGYFQNASAEENAYDWSRLKGASYLDDHTYSNGSGHYVMASGEKGKANDYVALESRQFSSNGSLSLVFSYHAYSMFYMFSTTGSLALVTKDHVTGSEVQQWFLVADGNNTWRSACVPLPAAERLSVAFVAMRGHLQRADIAVDDISLLNNRCDEPSVGARIQAVQTKTPEVPAPVGCPDGYGECRSGMCLNITHFCDGIPDCVDMSDEQNCPR